MPHGPALPRGYRRHWLRAEVLAGLAIWAVLIPEGFACAQIAGVPPETGLYAMVPALLCYAVLGGPERVPVGPVSVTAALSAMLLAPYAGGGRFVALSAALALVAGCAGVVAGLARLGVVASLISRPVLQGFTVGLALSALIGQLPKLLGLPEVSGGPGARCRWLAGHLGEVEPRTALLGGAALAAVLAGRKWLPAAPIAFVAIILGVAVSRILWLDTRGVEVVDPIDHGLPAPAWPTGTGAADLLGLAGPGVAVLIIGLAEGTHATKTDVVRQDRVVDPNRELVGIGLANLGSGMLSGMVVGGRPPAAAVPAGARTRLSALIAAGLAVLTVAFLAGMYERLPRTVLAAIAMAVIIELVDPPGVRRLYRVWRERRGSVYGRAATADCGAAVSTSLAVPVLGILPGLLAALVFSTVLLAWRARRAGSLTVESTTPADGVLLIRVAAGVFFANAAHLCHAVLTACTPHTRLIVLDALDCPVFDITAARALGELSAELAWRGIAVRVVRGTAAIRDASGQAWSGGARVGVYPTVAAAVTAESG